jgi:hypothetical protein
VQDNALLVRVEHGDDADEVREIDDHEEIVDEEWILKRQAIMNYLNQLESS